MFSLLLHLFAAKAQIDVLDKYPVYNGNDLGLLIHLQNLVFRIWAPTAEKAELIFYKDGAWRITDADNSI